MATQRTHNSIQLVFVVFILFGLASLVSYKPFERPGEETDFCLCIPPRHLSGDCDWRPATLKAMNCDVWEDGFRLLPLWAAGRVLPVVRQVYYAIADQRVLRCLEAHDRDHHSKFRRPSLPHIVAERRAWECILNLRPIFPVMDQIYEGSRWNYLVSIRDESRGNS